MAAETPNSQISLINKEIFDNFNTYLEAEQELREKIREIMRDIDHEAKKITLELQIIHSSLTGSKKKSFD